MSGVTDIIEEQDDTIFLLERALVSAYGLAEFLYHCLETEGYTHAYPGMSRETLERIEEFLPPRPPLCVHSMYRNDCESCRHAQAIRVRSMEIVKKRA